MFLIRCVNKSWKITAPTPTCFAIVSLSCRLGFFFSINSLERLIAFGSSPRGTIALDIVARAMAWMNNRDYVMPSDILAVIKDVLRHRVIPSFEAKSQNITSDMILDMLIQKVPMP